MSGSPPLSESEENQNLDDDLCNLYIDEFKAEFPGLTLADKCPACDCMGAKHPRRPPAAAAAAVAVGGVPSSSKHLLSATPLAFMKLKDQLPQWTKSTDCRQFLKRIDLVLKINDGIPESDWPRVFLYVIEDQPAQEWVMTNIIDAKLDWQQAKTTFTAHFQKAEYGAVLLRKFHALKQLAGESVQAYADRFLDVCHELERDGFEKDPLVMDHFLQHVHPDIRHKYHDWLANQRINHSDVSYQVATLGELVTACIIYDVSARTAVNVTPNYSTSSSSKVSNDERKAGDPKPKMYCSHHKSNSHNTADCRLKSGAGESRSPAAAASPKPVYKNRDTSSVRCYNCQAMGHYSNQCPRPKSSGSTTAGSSSSSTGSAYSKPTEPAKSVASKSARAHVPGDRSSSDSEAPARVWLYDSVRNRHFATLVDTGANVSFIDSALVKELSLSVKPLTGTIELAKPGLVAKREGITDILSLQAIFTFQTDIAVQQVAHVFELMELHVDQYQFVIGKDLLKILFPVSLPVCFYTPDATASTSPSMCRMRMNVIQQLVADSAPGVVDNLKMLDEMSSSGFGPLPAEELHERAMVSTPLALEKDYDLHREEILQDPLVVQAMAENDALSGFCKLPESVVHLEVDSEFGKSGYRKQYGVPNAAHDAVTEQVEKWFATGKIAEAPPNCQYNSSLTVATKKDAYGTFTGWRICLDTRPLNNAIKGGDRFQLPYIRDVLEMFHGCNYFGELDLSEAYLQFQLDPESQPLTAFTWGGKQYMFVGCPFGVRLLPSYFQRVMCKAFHDLTFTCPYLDNFPFGSKTKEEHKTHLLLLLRRCNESGLKVKLSAMKVCHSEIRCLGHLLTHEGIKLSPSKLDFVASCSYPKTGKELQSFLGAITFLRPNVRHMSELTASLESVKNVPGELTWTARMQTDFDTVKHAIATAPTLCYPNFNKCFHIATDASNTGVGGVLYQPDEYGGDITPFNIVAFCSKKLNGAQVNYPAYKKELFGVVYCLRQFHQYVWGLNDLVIFTDHKPLTHIFEQRELAPAVQQWLDVLLNYSFSIVYREGKLNVLPDHLSRMYSSDYEGGAWGVPAEMPWKVIQTPAAAASAGSASVAIRAVQIEEVSSEQLDEPLSVVSAADDDSKSSLVGGENAEAFLNSNEISSEMLAKAMIAIEKSGYTIPLESERSELIKTEHAFGHFGRDAVCRALIRKNFWWPGMRLDITTELANCDSCTRYTVTRSGFNPAQFITAGGPFHHLQIDNSVHLPAAPGGYKALLVIICVFTGFIILRPIKTTSADIIAAELWSVFCLLGVPKILQSDNGPEFTNEVIRALVKLTGVEHRFISPYNPRADGKVERSIQTIMSIIKKLIHGNETNWTLFVPFAQLSFNNKIAELTGSTPFSLMFGRQLNEMKDYTLSNEEEAPPVNIQEWSEHMEKLQSLIYPAILERTVDKKDTMITRLNKQRRLLTANAIPVGAVVMLRDPLRQNKFEPKYIGPYSVMRRTRNGNYQLKDQTGEMLERHIPPDQLKLVSKKARPQDLANNVYEIEKILAHRGSPGAYEYRIKWKNYHDITWEPASNFQDTALISNYWQGQQEQL
jgi:RNase H-like domain found in reverse transcriptase/Reverse transcriptase (RNA-dependent DNA polymerase)/Integrase core domain/Integrase zinc binding domain/Chromo (CHRromatin Organisation MOdifier) domain/Retrotransposon gag protein/Zinc knuckle